MTDPLELARFLPALRGAPRTLRAPPSAGAVPAPDEAFVVARAPLERERRAPLRSASFLRFPGTGGGHVLLDARDAHAFRAGARLLPRGRTLTRVASGLVRATASVGLHRRIAPGRVTIVERADAPGRALHERFAGLPADLAWNVASGVPGRDQKTIVQLVAPRGSAVAYAKLAHTPSSRALVERESRVLRRLAELGVAAPRLLGAETCGDTTLLVQTALTGARSPGQLAEPQRRWLARLTELTSRDLALASVPSVHAARARFTELGARPGATWCAVFGALDEQLALAGTTRVRSALAHGDFTPWNVVVSGAEAAAFDWEHARELAPCGHDALHFAVQQAVLVDRVAPARLFAHVAELVPDHAFANRGLNFAAYVFDIATHDETIQLEQRSPFEQVDWLRDARLALARAVLGHLRAAATRERAA